MAAETRRTLSEGTNMTEALQSSCQLMELKRGTSYDIDGKFSYSQVANCGLLADFKTTIDEHGKFSYFSSDMRPVPPVQTQSPRGMVPNERLTVRELTFQDKTF